MTTLVRDGTDRPPVGEAVGAVVLVGVAVLFVYEGLQLGMSDGRMPGPGLAPVVVGAALGVGGLGCLLRTLIHWQRSTRTEPVESDGEETATLQEELQERVADDAHTGSAQRASQGRWRPAVAVLLVSLYLLVIPAAGYLLATVLFVSAFLLLMGWRGRKLPVAAVTAAIAAWALFDLLLGVPLPAGPLG